MMHNLKAEFKKLLSVRSTYFIALIALGLIVFLAFYVQGFKNSEKDALASTNLFLAGTVMMMATIISVFAGVTALLLMAHEYRYNTIIYTLTASNSRSKVLLSKILVIMAYVFVLSLVLGALGVGLVSAGVAASGHHLMHQDINYLTYLAKVIFYSEGYSLAALLFITLIRNQVGALAALFIIPGTVEGLLGLLLKHNSVYMPFTGLAQVIQPPALPGVMTDKAHEAATGYLSAPRGSVVFLAYLVFGWIIAWYLFLRRDATT